MTGPNLERDCGSCTECCIYFKITPIKPGLTPCKFLANPVCDSGNCTSYDNRPDVCVNYKCMWLYGNGNEEDRPDKSGVMVDNAIPVVGALRAIPVRKGAADTPEGMVAITNISRDRNQPVLVCAFPETRLVRIVGRGVE